MSGSTPPSDTPASRELVTLDVRNGVATLTLNNPAERNTLTAPLVEAIVAAVDRCEADPAVGAVVVTGAPPAFCAGANLGNLSTADEHSLGQIYEGFLRVARCTLPTLAAVNGAAVGAGMNMALACDVRIAARRAKFDTRFMQIGLHPGGGHTWMFRRIAGPQTAAAALLFSDVLDGQEAERVGLVYRCVADDDLMAAAQAMAERAASAPRELLIETKQTLADMGAVADHPTAVARELTPQLWSAGMPWFAERIAALQARISKN